MITVRGRSLVIPNTERVIGTDMDANSEVRHFRIQRVPPGGIDISHLVFHIDLYYQGGQYDTDLVDKEVQEEYILLTWKVKGTVVAHTGTVFVSLRALDGNGTVKWGTDRAPCYVAGGVNTPGNLGNLTELETYETLIAQAKQQSDAMLGKCDDAISAMDAVKQETLDAMSGAKAEAEESIRVSEEVRGQAEAAVQQAAGAASDASASAEEAEAWAHGRDDYPETVMDNSLYWCRLSGSEAERAKQEADRAQMISGVLAPEFWFDPEESKVYIRNGNGVEFILEESRLYWKLNGSITGGGNPVYVEAMTDEEVDQMFKEMT